jgi:hypothetical protein
MCQRRFAIQFPMQANALQHLKINPVATIDFWQVFLRKQYKSVPGWMYTKGVKKTQEVKEKQISVSNEVIIEYCRYFNIDHKTIIDALKFYPQDIIAELRQFENILKQK